ncbi:MAG: hypothetical protein H6R12_626 [Proteobacteria bacterium]|nr:hypothetical protein [Pseudomonadota bacterium]
MPAALRLCIDRGVTSRPANAMRPASGRSAPDTTWIRVVLPAPLGPISA